MAVAVGQVGRDLDLLPAFGGKRLGLRLKLLSDQPVEQDRVLQPATVIALEEIAQHDTARRLTGIDAQEDRAAIRRPDRGLGQHAADRIRCDTQTSMAKWYATEMAVEIAGKAVQIHGGNGITREFPVERHFRSAKVLPIPDGTTEIQKLVIGRNLTGLNAFRDGSLPSTQRIEATGLQPECFRISGVVGPAG